MPRGAVVPAELKRTAFTYAQALSAGLTEDQLRSACWQRLGRNVFAWSKIAEQRLVRLQAALLRLREGAVLSGRSAGWLHGLDLDPCDPIEVTVPKACQVTRRSGVVIHHGSCERASVRGLLVTSRLQTVVDLARRSSLVESVVILDMALHRRVVQMSSLGRWLDAHPGRRGVARLREAINLAEPATESPMETRLRLLLVLAGFPRPLVQPTLRDRNGTFLARPDLYYPIHRLAIEYDGATHKDSIVADNRRQNRLLEAGYTILRFSAADVLGNPAAVVSLVRRTIARPG